MAFRTKILPDILKSVTDNVRRSMQGYFYDSLAPYFDYNTVTSMVNLLTEKDGSNFLYKKYPLIYFLLPFDENYNTNYPVLFEATCKIYIITETDAHLYAKDRYDSNFKNILYPIFQQLITELRDCEYLFNADLKEFTKTDLMYWGSGGNANIANDRVDAIEISNLKLKIINNKICKNE